MENPSVKKIKKNKHKFHKPNNYQTALAAYEFT